MEKPRPFNGRVIFDHLPKTGGQAVNAWLTNTLGTGTVTTNLIGEHRALIRRYGGAYAVISGHLSFQQGGLDPRYQYFTCFREPVDRAISWLFFTLNNHDEPMLGTLWRQAERFVVSEGEDLDPDLAGHIQNVYARHFLPLTSQGGSTDAEISARVLSVIDQYDAWGLFEDFRGFLAEVAALMRLPTPDEIERVNVTRVRPTTDKVRPRLRKRLEELNGLDMALYDGLRERWGSRLGGKVETALVKTSPWSLYNVRRSGRSYSVPGFQLLAAKLEGKATVGRGEPLLFEVEFSLSAAIPELQIGINIYDEDNRLAFGTDTTLLKQPLTGIRAGTHRMQYCLMADLPEGSYTLGFAFAELRENGRSELAWYDKLAAFAVSVARPQGSVGYASLPVVASYRQTSEETVGAIRDASGTLKVNAALDHVAAGEEFFLPVRVENTSTQNWVNAQGNPLSLSYHWLDRQGTPVIYEGHRTPFPVTMLAPAEAFSAQIRVVAPDGPGLYRLVLTAVQEGYCWLDQRGFAAFAFDAVSVGEITEPARVAAAAS